MLIAVAVCELEHVEESLTLGQAASPWACMEVQEFVDHEVEYEDMLCDDYYREYVVQETVTNGVTEFATCWVFG
jgi:hypothetical protein